MELKDRLKQRRKELGYTLKEVADLVGVSEATVSRWECGDIANMRRDRIVKLAQALHISPEDIIGVDPDTETDSPKWPEGFGSAIKDYRNKHSLSMQEFADRCGLSKGYISMLEGGSHPQNGKEITPSIATVQKVASAMGMTIEVTVTDSPKWPEDFGSRIRSRRLDLGLTQSQLAERIGCADKSSISKIEKGINDIPLSKVRDLAVALDTTPSYLLGLSSDQTEQRRYDGRIRIGDEVWVHGYVDEIRRDVIIIRNTGGYFGTVPEEIARGERRYEEEDTVDEGDA